MHEKKTLHCWSGLPFLFSFLDRYIASFAVPTKKHSSSYFLACWHSFLNTKINDRKLNVKFILRETKFNQWNNGISPSQSIKKWNPSSCTEQNGQHADIGAQFLTYVLHGIIQWARRHWRSPVLLAIGLQYSTSIPIQVQWEDPQEVASSNVTLHLVVNHRELS